MRRYLCQQFTWDDDWIRPLESNYSILRNIAKINASSHFLAVLQNLTGTPNIIWNEFYCSAPCGGGIPVEHTATRKFRQLFTNVEICSLPSLELTTWENLISHKLRGCPACMKLGYHSWMYQHKAINRCPIHNIDLIEDIDSNVWADDFKYLPYNTNLDLKPLETMYHDVFHDIKKIYYLDFFQNKLNDKTLSLKIKVSLSGNSYTESGEHITHTPPQDMKYIQHISEDGILWFARLKKAIHALWDENNSIKMPNIFEYLLSQKLESIECRKPNEYPLITELMIVVTTLICELLSSNKFQFSAECLKYYPYLYLASELIEDDVHSFANILWNYLSDVRGCFDYRDVLDFSNLKSIYCYAATNVYYTLSTLNEEKFPFIGFDKNKAFLSCVEDHFQYQWQKYQELFNNFERKTTKYAWADLPAISYIILQNQDDSFDSYRITDEKY